MENYQIILIILLLIIIWWFITHPTSNEEEYVANVSNQGFSLCAQKYNTGIPLEDANTLVSKYGIQCNNLYITADSVKKLFDQAKYAYEIGEKERDNVKTMVDSSPSSILSQMKEKYSTINQNISIIAESRDNIQQTLNAVISSSHYLQMPYDLKLEADKVNIALNDINKAVSSATYLYNTTAALPKTTSESINQTLNTNLSNDTLSNNSPNVGNTNINRNVEHDCRIFTKDDKKDCINRNGYHLSGKGCPEGQHRCVSK